MEDASGDEKVGGAAAFNRKRIGEMVGAVKDLYGDAPGRVEILPGYVERKYGKRARSIPAVFDSEKDRIVINSRSPAWRDMRAVARRQFDRGWWSTDSEYHALIHEIGHAVHYKLDRANYDRLAGASFPKAAIADLAGKVSRYGMEGPLEFVAETFTGLFEGKTYDSAVMKWYKHRIAQLKAQLFPSLAPAARKR
jgi:hypothetical protein